MRTCLNGACNNTVWWLNTTNYCTDCGEELAAALTCPCGNPLHLREEIRRLQRTARHRFCEQCGQPWTEAFLSSRMSASLSRDLASLQQGWTSLLQEPS